MDLQDAREGSLSRLVVLALVAAMALSGCHDPEELRAAAQGADELAHAVEEDHSISAVWRGLEIGSAAQEGALAALRATARFDDVANRISVEDRAREALDALLWDVGCDVVTGNIPLSADDIKSWLVTRAVGFGLEFAGGGEQIVGQALFDSLDTQDEQSDAAAACSHLASSGL
jgi:hypothetical protein